MKKITALTFVLVSLSAMFVPQDAQAWSAKVQLFRCMYWNIPSLCYAAETKVYVAEDAHGHIESCDIKGTDEEGWITFPGLEVTGNSVYGPGYVNMAPGHAVASRNDLFGCTSSAQTARYEGMKAGCVAGGLQGYWHTAFHNVRWRQGAHGWRGDNVSTTRSINFPWALNGDCPCEE